MSKVASLKCQAVVALALCLVCAILSALVRDDWSSLLNYAAHCIWGVVAGWSWATARAWEAHAAREAPAIMKEDGTQPQKSGG